MLFRSHGARSVKDQPNKEQLVSNWHHDAHSSPRSRLFRLQFGTQVLLSYFYQHYRFYSRRCSVRFRMFIANRDVIWNSREVGFSFAHFIPITARVHALNLPIDAPKPFHIRSINLNADAYPGSNCSKTVRSGIYPHEQRFSAPENTRQQMNIVIVV